MAEAVAASTPGGLAAGVRWDLSHLYAGPDDPQVRVTVPGFAVGSEQYGTPSRRKWEKSPGRCT